MGWRDALRALIDSDEADEVEEVADEVEADEAGDEAEADEVEGGEVEADEAGDEAEADEAGDEVEGTPGDEQESPEVAELRQQIVEQAAEIETLRNRLAAAGLEDEIGAEEVVEDDTADEFEEDAVEAFDSDYAEREAILAEITKDN